MTFQIKKMDTLSSEKPEIPEDLQEEWESYLAACESLEVKPSARRFLRYNELYPYK
tara:strand:- start:39 stop:206 length:168 start_codon:yes stop_codon:yes gene_type:complete